MAKCLFCIELQFFDSKLSHEVETVRWSQRKVLTRHGLFDVVGKQEEAGSERG